ncbi:MAG: bacillithiol biosynthesis BshC, partial [Betaproteobacteria bacterium]|nr:bacillithiol biosynthesis BshC [Betaproteobacteria bacterium]
MVASLVGIQTRPHTNQTPLHRLTLPSHPKQYEGVEISAKVASNLQLLALDNTYTVCTAHQPCLLTGYLYFIYKILHAVKLAESLEVQHPDKHFVPVFYMGSEDNDFEELSCFRFRGDKYRWQKGDKAGAVGRMLLQGITEDVLKPLFKYFGPPGKNMETLKEHIL